MNARRAFVALGAVAVTLVLPAASAHAGSEGESRTLRQSRAEVLAYWTPERMAAARPASEALADLPASDLIDSVVNTRRPSRRAAQPVSNPSAAPSRTHGKVFMRLEGDPFVCSGTVVRAKTRRLAVTAGHCVYGDVDSFLPGGDPGAEFATNLMFVPGKDGDTEPYGRWTARRVATTSQYVASENVRYDVGMVTVKARNGKRLQNAVGARRMAFGRRDHFDAFGYPQQPPFNGKQLYRCSSPAEQVDYPSGGSGPATNRIDCNMTGGSSGGAWLISGGRVNSVISYEYECPRDPVLDVCIGPDPDGDKLYGPYFGDVIQDLYRAERRRR